MFIGYIQSVGEEWFGGLFFSRSTQKYIQQDDLSHTILLREEKKNYITLYSSFST